MQESALTFVIDGSGEEMATSVWKCKRNKLPELIDVFELPDSLGYFYGAITEYLGFSIFTGEGKVMGMAPYGKPNKFIRNKLKEFLFLDDQKKYFLDPKYIYFGPRSTSFKHTDLLSNLLNEQPRVQKVKLIKFIWILLMRLRACLRKQSALLY